MRPLNVLSLFDGISCGRVALERAEIPVNKYFASEIDKYAIQITQKNYPDTIQIGDVTKVDWTPFAGKIDLLIGGSPCQSLSITQSKTRKNLDGKSKLFFEYVRALKEVKPRYFLLENVASMKDECKNIISSYMGVEPIFINSNCFSAQDRERYYWTNLPVETKYLTESNLNLSNIIENSVDEKYYYKEDYVYLGDKQVCAILNISGHDILKRVHSVYYKSHALTTCGGGNTQKKILINGRVRKLTPREYERLQTLPDNYTEGVSDSRRYTAIGNGWTVDVIAYILKFLRTDLEGDNK